MSILKRQVLFVLFAFAATLCAFAQNKTITGLVVDGNGESIIGASVLVKGTTNGIITDIDGKFTLNDVPEAGVIQISYIGYKTQEISAKNKTNLKVVLVEDNEINMEIARTLLEFRNASVDGACNGQQAVEMFRSSPQNHYDAVLMDVRMPVMDGIAATQAIRGLDRADAATVPILAMTANAFAEDIERSRKAGMNEHLAKPIEPETLYARLASYFR